MPSQDCNGKSTVMQDILVELAGKASQASGFVQRRSKMNGELFVQMMVLGCLEQPEASLNDFAKLSEDLGVSITAPGIDQRVNAQSVELLTCLLKETIQRCRVRKIISNEILKPFSAVRILDSSHIALPKALAVLYKGSGGDGPEAGAKIQLSYEYLSGEISAIEVTDGRSPDQKCSLHTGLDTPGSLHLFDLGYFKQGVFAILDKSGSYIVSRFQSQTALYWGRQDSAGFDVLAFTHSVTGNQREIDAFLGRKVRVPVRVLFQRLPAEVVAERRRKAKETMRRQGKTPSTRYLQLLEWTIYITNVPEEWLAFEQVQLVYRLRWQIELIFKLWKSQAKLNQIGSWRAARALCQLYARLIALVLFHWLVAPHRFSKPYELSLVKAYRVVQRHTLRLAIAIASGWRTVADVISRIERDFRRFAQKDSRKKSPSTYHRLLEAGA